MKTKRRIKTVEEVPLTAYEQSIENSLDATGGVVADAATLAAARAGLDHLATRLRGGSRPGAGRKPRAYVKTTVLLSPEGRAKLDRLATEYGSLSAAAERAIEKA